MPIIRSCSSPTSLKNGPRRFATTQDAPNGSVFGSFASAVAYARALMEVIMFALESGSIPGMRPLGLRGSCPGLYLPASAGPGEKLPEGVFRGAGGGGTPYGAATSAVASISSARTVAVTVAEATSPLIPLDSTRRGERERERNGWDREEGRQVVC